jgi:hypothetical protein
VHLQISALPEIITRQRCSLREGFQFRPLVRWMQTEPVPRLGEPTITPGYDISGTSEVLSREIGALFHELFLRIQHRIVQLHDEASVRNRSVLRVHGVGDCVQVVVLAGIEFEKATVAVLDTGVTAEMNASETSSPANDARKVAMSCCTAP